jgi:hypothetical protein
MWRGIQWWSHHPSCRSSNGFAVPRQQQQQQMLRSLTTSVATYSSFSWSSIQQPSQVSCFSSSSSSSTSSNSNTSTSNTVLTTPWADPAMRRYKFWNREADFKTSGKYSYLLEISPESVKQEARIISLADIDYDDASSALHDGQQLPLGSRLLHIGKTVQDFEHLIQKSSSSSSTSEQPNVIFVSPSCPNASIVLPTVLAAFPQIRWIHVRSAGIDFIESDELASITTKKQIMMTNAKGQFSSSLAEYALMACSYFAKNIPRLIEQKNHKIWQNYNIEELYVLQSIYTIFVRPPFL